MINLYRIRIIVRSMVVAQILTLPSGVLVAMAGVGVEVLLYWKCNLLVVLLAL